jgi:hypothetical protein
VKVEVAERTWGHRDWLDLFATWRNDTITELKAAYGGRDIVLEFEAVTERTKRSSPRFTFEYRKTAVRSGIQHDQSPFYLRLSLTTPSDLRIDSAECYENLTCYTVDPRVKPVDASRFRGTAIASSYPEVLGRGLFPCI